MDTFMSTVLLLVVWVSCTLAASLPHDHTAAQEDIVELIKNLQHKYNSQLEEYASRLTRYEARMERYEQQVDEYETKLKVHESRIKDLEQKLEDKEERITEAEQQSGGVNDTPAASSVKANEKTKAKQGSRQRSQRLVMSEGATPVAFYAQLTKDIGGIGNFQAIVFDLVTTNIGNTYNKADGVFTAPITGTYAFIWTASNNQHTHMQTELVVNAVVKGRQWSDSYDHADVSSATGSAVLSLQTGDTVWIRSNTAHTHSIMGSQLTSFSGWLLF